MSFEEGYGLDFNNDWNIHLREQTNPKSKFYSRRFERKINLPRLLPYEAETPKEQGKILARIISNIYFSIESLDLEGSLKISRKEWEEYKGITDVKERSEGVKSCSDDIDMDSEYGNEDELISGDHSNDDDDDDDFTYFNLTFSTKQLLIWLKMKYDLPLDLRVRLAHVYYAICVSRGQRVPLKLCLRILEKLTEDVQLVRNELVLPYEDLLNEILMHFIPDKVTSLGYQHKDLEFLIDLAHVASRFFKAEALPKAYSSLGSELSIFNASRILSSFEILPIKFNFSASIDEYDIRYYIESFFFIMAKFKKNKGVMNEVLDILGRIATNFMEELAWSSTEVTQVSLSNCVVFADSQMERVFDIVLNGLDILPQMLSSVQIEDFNSVTSLIVFSMTNENLRTDGKMFDLLETLFNALQRFVHPSNSGKWSSKISQLSLALTTQFLARINGEKEIEGNIVMLPETHKLNNQSCENFIKLILPILKSGVYSRNNSKNYESSLGMLAHINPHVVLDDLILDIYDSLQDLVYTHRANTALKLIGALSRYVTESPIYRVHVTNMILVSIKDMNSNDLEKTILILDMITSFAAVTPFEDLTDGQFDSYLAESFINDHLRILKNQKCNLGNAEEELQQFSEFYNETEALKSSTALFKPIVELFCSRIVSLFQILEDHSDIQKLHSRMQYLMNYLPGAMSSKLFRQFRDEMVEFCTEQSFYKCSDIIGCIFSSITKVEPRSFDNIAEVLIGRIKEDIIENNGGTAMSKYDMKQVDERLFWDLTILNSSIGNAGRSIFKWKNELVSLTKLLINHVKGVNASPASNLVNHMLQNTTKIRVVNGTLFSPSHQAIDESCWGCWQFDSKRFSPENLNFEWYVPKVDDAEFATQFFIDVTRHCLLDLKRLTTEVQANTSTSSSRSGNEIYSRLLFLTHGISGISWLIDPDFDYALLESHFIEGDVLEIQDKLEGFVETIIIDESSHSVKHKLESGELSKKSNHHKYSRGAFFALTNDIQVRKMYLLVHSYRFLIGKAIKYLFSFLHTFYSDNSKLMDTFVALTNFYLTDIGCERLLPSSNGFQSYESMAKSFRIRGIKKPYSRALMASRISSYHALRISHATSNRRLSGLDKKVLELLVKMSFSAYEDVSSKANTALFGVMKWVSGAYGILIKCSLQELMHSLDTMEEKRIESGLSLLNSKRIRLKLKNDYNNLDSYLQALRRCSSIDNFTIEGSIKKIYRDLTSKFILPSSVCLIDLSMIESLKPIGETQLKIKRIHQLKNSKRKRYLRMVEDVIERMLDETKHGYHWGIRRLEIELLGTLSSDIELPVSTSLLSYLLAECAGDNPQVSKAATNSLSKLLQKSKLLGEVNYNIDDVYNSSLVRNGYKQVATTNEYGGTFYHEWKSEMSNTVNPTYYVDKGTTSGWLFWNKTLTVKTLNLNSENAIASQTLDEISHGINSEWLSNLIELWNAQHGLTFEMDKSHIDLVSMISIAIAKGHVTSVNYAEFFELILKSFTKDELSTHMTMCDFLAGIISSVYYLEVKLRQSIDNYLYEFFITLFCDGINSDNKNIWRLFVLWYSHNIDHRLLPNTSKIFLEPSTNGEYLPPVQQSQKLSYMCTFLIGNYWEVFELDDVLKYCSLNFVNSSSNLREETGILLSFLSFNHFMLSSSDFIEFLEECNNSSEASPNLLIKEKGLLSLVKSLFEMTGRFKLEVESWELNDLRLSHYSYAASSLLVFLHHIYSYSSGSYFSSLICDCFFPFLFDLMEAKNLCQNEGFDPVSIIKMIGQSYIPQDILGDVIMTVSIYVSEKNNVSQLLVAGDFIKAFYFKNVNRLSRAQRTAIITVVEGMTRNRKVEIREQSAITLATLIYLTPPQDTKDLIKKLTKEYEKVLDGFRMSYGPRKFKGVPIDDHIEVHASILGLGAIVEAFGFFSPPPSWIPRVLDIISRSSSGMDGVLSKTAKEILTKFKGDRTETWHLDSQIFNANQLEQFEGSRRSYFV